MRLVFLDSGPLWTISNPLSKPGTHQCWEWARAMLAAGARIFVPEIADYEVRRELVRRGATAGLARLDRVVDALDFGPINRDVMLKAGELWAASRNSRRPTSSPDALDGDCILAATALLAADPGDVLTVATLNVGHLAQFVDARPWEKIAP